MSQFRFRGNEAPTAQQRASRFEAAPEDDSNAASIYLYDPIDSWGGMWGVSAVEFGAALETIGQVDQINLYINSPGGEMWDAMAIANQLRRHPARVVAVVDGVAASAASLIAISADECVMGIGAQMMIHDASNIAMGNQADMLQMAERLDKDSNGVAAMYASKAGGDASAWRELMRAETWYSADEAVEAGLADRAIELGQPEGVPSVEQSATNTIERYRSNFRYAGRQDAHKTGRSVGRLPADRNNQSPVPGPVNTTHMEDSMSAFTDGIRDRLGITDPEVTDEQVLAALDEALAERADPEPDQNQNALPEGMVAIDEATLASLQADASAGRAARNEQVEAHRVAVVDAAINSGRIPPARREHWLAQLAIDPAVESVLQAMPEGLIPVGSLIGTADNLDAMNDEAMYQMFFGNNKRGA